jgi:hypothetical protein
MVGISPGAGGCVYEDGLREVAFIFRSGISFRKLQERVRDLWNKAKSQMANEQAKL